VIITIDARTNAITMLSRSDRGTCANVKDGTI